MTIILFRFYLQRCGGAVVSTSALDFDADFVCTRCGLRTPRPVLDKLEDQIGESLEETDKEDRAALELLLELSEPLLHPTNYLVLQVKIDFVARYQIIKENNGLSLSLDEAAPVLPVRPPAGLPPPPDGRGTV